MATFILIRHAEAAWSDDEGRSLSAAGLRAAESLPDRLHGIRLDAIYGSPYRRAQQTAAPLAERLGLPILEAADLRERALGSIHPASFEEAVAATCPTSTASIPGASPIAAPSGAS